MAICRDLPPGTTRDWQSLATMYTGIVRNGTGPGTAPPSTFGDSQAFSYISDVSTRTLTGGGIQKRAFNIALFNDVEARSCLLTYAGFNAGDISQVNVILQNPVSEANAAALETMRGHLSDFQKNVLNGMVMIATFEQNHDDQHPELGGSNRANPDNAADHGDPNVITDFEIQQYAAEVYEDGDQNPQYEATAGRIITGINGVMGLMTFLTTPPPPPARTPEPVRLNETHQRTDSISLAAPQGGWQAGDLIYINDQAYAAPIAPTGAMTVNLPASANGFHDGLNNVTVKNGTQTFVTLPVTIQPAAVAVVPETSSGEASWFDRPHLFGWSGRTWAEVGGLGAATIGVGVLGLRLRGARGEARVEGEGRARAEREVRDAASVRDAAEARVRDLSDQVSGARRALDVARPDVPAVEARVRDLEAELRRAQDALEDARGDLEFKGNSRQRGAAESRFDSALQSLEAKEAEAAKERAAVRDIEGRNPDDPMLPQHRESLAMLEGQVQTARNAVAEAARGNAKNGDVAAREAAAQRIHDARAEVRRIEADLAASRATLSQAQGIGNAYNLLGARPASATPPAVAPRP